MDALEQIRRRKISEMMSGSGDSKQPQTKRGPVVVTDTNFDSTVSANRIVVVDCWAEWCYPCRMMAPIVDELANEYSSVATFSKLNVDENPSTAMRYDIQSIPTLLIIKSGVEVDRIIGAQPKAQIEAILKKHL
jgi:thioredoxin 1